MLMSYPLNLVFVPSNVDGEGLQRCFDKFHVSVRGLVDITLELSRDWERGLQDDLLLFHTDRMWSSRNSLKDTCTCHTSYHIST